MEISGREIPQNIVVKIHKGLAHKSVLQEMVAEFPRRFDVRLQLQAVSGRPDKATAAAGRGGAIHINTSVVGGYSVIGISNRQPE